MRPATPAKSLGMGVLAVPNTTAAAAATERHLHYLFVCLVIYLYGGHSLLDLTQYHIEMLIVCLQRCTAIRLTVAPSLHGPVWYLQ